MRQQIRRRHGKEQLRPRGNIKIHESFTIQRDTHSKCQVYNELNSPWT